MSTIEPKEITLSSGRAVLIRMAMPEDAAQILDYMAAIWSEEPSFNITMADEAHFDVEREARWIQEHLDANDCLALVVEAEGAIVGTLNCETPQRRRLAHSTTFGISLAIGWRDRGIGRHLIQSLLDWATAHPHIEKVGLAVFATNERAIHLYRSLGFAEEGRRYRSIKYDEHTYIDDVLMYRWVGLPSGQE